MGKTNRKSMQRLATVDENELFDKLDTLKNEIKLLELDKVSYPIKDSLLKLLHTIVQKAEKIKNEIQEIVKEPKFKEVKRVKEGTNYYLIFN